MYSDKSGCILAKRVVFGQSNCIRSKVVKFGQSCCIWADVLVFGQSGCIRAKVVVIGQKLMCLGNNGCIQTEWFYSGKVSCIFAK